MKTWNVVLGVDVSKKTVDICWAERKLFIHIDNNSEGFRKFKKWCKDNQIDLRETFIVLEYTGGYEYRFIQFCESQCIAYRRVPGLEIKQSMGMIRGKSDKADAFRIGQYGEDKIKRLEPSKLLDNKILELKTLLSYDERRDLLKAVSMYRIRCTDYPCAIFALIISILNLQHRPAQTPREGLCSLFTIVCFWSK